MDDFFPIALKTSLVFFMVGNLFAVGLDLKLREAFAGLRNIQFVVLSVMWGFILGPALAVLLTHIFPLSEPYAIGLIFVGMAPCAPFLPRLVTRARGDLDYAAAFMLLAFVLTVIYVPFVGPFLIKGLSASAWTIGKPLVLFLLVPLILGLSIQSVSARTAKRLKPLVERMTAVMTVLMLVFCVLAFGGDLFSAVGTLAVGAQVLFFAVATSASYFFSIRLPERERSVLALGMSTRNFGAAFAPLMVIPGLDERSMMMVAVGVPLQAIVSLLSARWLGVRAAVGEPVMAPRFKRS